MAFQEIISLEADQTISLGGSNRKTGKKNPTSVEGYYLGSKPVQDAKKQSGKSYIHIFQTPKGNLGVWGKTDMDRKLLSCTPGTMLRVSHTGMRATKNGEMYVYKVEQDQDNTIEVATSTASFNQDGSSSGSESREFGTESEGFGTEDIEEEAFEEEAPEALQAPVVALAGDAAARRAKVAAMLNKRR